MKLGLGTVQFGLDYGISNTIGKTSISEVQKIFAVAKQHNIRVIDTAAMYGTSEEVLGQVLKDSGDFDIVTKTPNFTDLEEAKKLDLLEKTFQCSLKKMQCSRVYGLLLHHADDLLMDGGNLLIEKMKELKGEGMVRKIGVSVYSSDQIDNILDRFDIDIIQLPINVFDQRLLASGHLVKLKKAGIEIHARSAFLQGLLLMEPMELPSYFDSIRPHIEYYHETLREYGVTPLQAAINFVAGIDEIDVVVCGVNNHSQLEDICGNLTSIDISKFFKFALFDENVLNPSKWKN